MRVEFLRKFSKDLDNVHGRTVKHQLLKFIEQVEAGVDVTRHVNVKKLVGHSAAYRLRIGDYRVGFFVVDQVVIFARLVHRKDIYKVFP